MNVEDIFNIDNGNSDHKRRIISKALRSLNYSKYGGGIGYAFSGTNFVKKLKLSKKSKIEIDFRFYLFPKKCPKRYANRILLFLQSWNSNYYFLDPETGLGSYWTTTEFKLNSELFKNLPKADFHSWSHNKSNFSSFVLTLLEIKVCKELRDIKEAIEKEIKNQENYRNLQREKSKRQNKN